jgi:hypothetical protein
MNITIKTIDHKDQRYDTVGDWFFEGGNLEIRVSKTGDWRTEALVAIHELAEVLLCKDRGIKDEEVFKFDILSTLDDPGLSIQAPYHFEHMTADIIERIMCNEFDLDWEKYDKELMEIK